MCLWEIAGGRLEFGGNIVIMGIACDVTACKNNAGGFCDKEDIYISDAETGEPICQDAEFDE